MHNLHAWENHILRLPRILSTRYQVSCSLTLLQFLQMCKAGAALNSHFNLFLRLALINAERTSTCTTGTVWPKCLPALPPFTGVTSQSSDCSVRWDKLCAAWSWTLRSLDWLVRNKLEPRRNDNGPWEYTKTDYFWALPSWSSVSAIVLSARKRVLELVEWYLMHWYRIFVRSNLLLVCIGRKYD